VNITAAEILYHAEGHGLIRQLRQRPRAQERLERIRVIRARDTPDNLHILVQKRSSMEPASSWPHPTHEVIPVTDPYRTLPQPAHWDTTYRAMLNRLDRPLTIHDLAPVAVWTDVARWLRELTSLLNASLSGGRAPGRLRDFVITQNQLHPFARGILWNTRDPNNVRPMGPQDTPAGKLKAAFSQVINRPRGGHRPSRWRP
jgi:hypothetical protein